MDGLIQKNDLINELLTGNQRCITSTGHELTMNMVLSFIKHQPSVDGANNEKQNNAKNNIALDNVFCQWKYIDSHSYRAMIPCTQKIRNIQAMRYYKFCPFCGKKMKVVENE